MTKVVKKIVPAIPQGSHPTGPISPKMVSRRLFTNQPRHHHLIPAKIGDISSTIAISEFSHLSQVAARVKADLLQVDGQQAVTSFLYRDTQE